MKKIKETPKKATKKKQTKIQLIKQKIISYIWSIFWKICLAFIAFMLVAGIYFDKKITNKFEGQIWSLPAKVYSRPLELFPSKKISINALVTELKMLNYRPVLRVQSEGQFSVKNNIVIIFRRDLNLPDHLEDSKRVKIDFLGSKISFIKDEKGTLLEKFYLDPLLLDRLKPNKIEDRIFVPFEEIPDLFIDTLLLMEDRNFYHHYGVSPFAIVRAFIANFKAGHTVQGGSTITQQLAKNLFLTKERSLWRKFQEAYIALLIEYTYSKDRILEAYLNEVYLGQNGKNGIFGIALASDFYFGRPLSELRTEQIALLVAILKGPSYYNPRQNLVRSLAQRDLVLRLMVENNYINSADYKYAVSDKIHLAKKNTLNLRSNPAFISFLNRELKFKVPSSVLKTNGISIFTSIDPILQKNAEITVHNGIAKIEKKAEQNLQAAMVITDRKNAEVLAMVADRKIKFSGFNRALDAKRPIGSLVKPAVYLTALEKGFPIDYEIDDKPIRLKNSTGQTWTPQNYDRKYRGYVSLAQGLIYSLNIPTVNLGMDVGLKNVILTLKKMGVKEKINSYPSLVLGSVSLSPFEVAQMYQPITMKGIYKPLSIIRSIRSIDFEVIYRRKNEMKTVFSKGSVKKLMALLHKVTTLGTARSLMWRNPNNSFAGKTGTTNNLKDSWFVGVDDSSVVTTWVGKDNNQTTGLTGSSGALVLFSDQMKMKNKI